MHINKNLIYYQVYVRYVVKPDKKNVKKNKKNLHR